MKMRNLIILAASAFVAFANIGTLCYASDDGKEESHGAGGACTASAATRTGLAEYDVPGIDWLEEKLRKRIPDFPNPFDVTFDLSFGGTFDLSKSVEEAG